MLTATTMIERDEKQIRKRMFEHMLEGFINHWAPADLRARAEFETQIVSLVRQVYDDAQAPVLDRLLAVYERLPMTTLLPTG